MRFSVIAQKFSSLQRDRLKVKAQSFRCILDTNVLNFSRMQYVDFDEIISSVSSGWMRNAIYAENAWHADST